MELRHLRYFVAVAEAENVTRAAAKLHVAQPAVSRQIRDLEEELGVALLERTAKAVHLTDAGRVFLDEARAVLKRTNEAVVAVRAVTTGGGGELHIGYAPSLTVQILPRALRRFQAVMPGVRVSMNDFSTEEMLAGLHAERLQLALMPRPDDRQMRGLRFHELARYPMCVAVAPGHALAKRRSLTLNDTLPGPLIGYSKADYPEYHVRLGELFAPLGGLPSVEEHDSVSSLIAAVEAGRGVSLVASCMACLVGNRLKIIPLEPAGDPIVVGAVCLKGPTSAAAQQFIDAAAAGTSE